MTDYAVEIVLINSSDLKLGTYICDSYGLPFEVVKINYNYLMTELVWEVVVTT